MKTRKFTFSTVSLSDVPKRMVGPDAFLDNTLGFTTKIPSKFYFSMRDSFLVHAFVFPNTICISLTWYYASKKDIRIESCCKE